MSIMQLGGPYFDESKDNINPSGNFEFKKIHELSDNETEKAKKILRELGYIK